MSAQSEKYHTVDRQKKNVLLYTGFLHSHPVNLTNRALGPPCNINASRVMIETFYEYNCKTHVPSKRAFLESDNYGLGLTFRSHWPSVVACGSHYFGWSESVVQGDIGGSKDIFVASTLNASSDPVLSLAQ